MTEEEVEALIEKYRKMSQNVGLYGEDKCVYYEQVADQISEIINTFIDNDDYESEEDILDDVKVIFDSQDGIFDDEDYEIMNMQDELFDE